MRSVIFICSFIVSFQFEAQSIELWSGMRYVHPGPRANKAASVLKVDLQPGGQAVVQAYSSSGTGQFTYEDKELKIDLSRSSLSYLGEAEKETQGTGEPIKTDWFHAHYKVFQISLNKKNELTHTGQRCFLPQDDPPFPCENFETKDIGEYVTSSRLKPLSIRFSVGDIAALPVTWRNQLLVKVLSNTGELSLHRFPSYSGINLSRLLQSPGEALKIFRSDGVVITAGEIAQDYGTSRVIVEYREPDGTSFLKTSVIALKQKNIDLTDFTPWGMYHTVLVNGSSWNTTGSSPVYAFDKDGFGGFIQSVYEDGKWQTAYTGRWPWVYNDVTKTYKAERYRKTEEPTALILSLEELRLCLAKDLPCSLFSSRHYAILGIHDGKYVMYRNLEFATGDGDQVIWVMDKDQNFF